MRDSLDMAIENTQVKRKNTGIKRKLRWFKLKEKIKINEYKQHSEKIKKRKGAYRKGRQYPKMEEDMQE